MDFSLWRHWFCRELSYTGRQIQQLCISPNPPNKHFRISNALDDICLYSIMSEQPHILGSRQYRQELFTQQVVKLPGPLYQSVLSTCILPLRLSKISHSKKSPEILNMFGGKKLKDLTEEDREVSKDIKNQLYRILLIVTWFDVFKFSCLFKLEDIRNFASSFVTKHGGRQLLFLSSCPSRVWEGTCFFVYILPCKHFSETGGLESAVEESKPRTGFRIKHQTRVTEQFAKRDMSVEFWVAQATRFERGSGWTAAACRGVKWCFSWEVVLIVDHCWLVQKLF